MQQINVRQIIEIIERVAPLSLQESWDNSGLQVGSLDCPLTGVVVSLDATIAALEYTIDQGANLLISHHPLLFEGIRSVTPYTESGAFVCRAIQAGVTVYSSHTPFDSCRGGLNDHICSVLDLHNVSILEPSAVDSTQGIGRVGKLPQSMNVADFAALLSDKFSLRNVRYSAFGDRVQRVALCSGSGASLTARARAAGADAYICGDVKYHDFQRSSSGISIFDIGHYESEVAFVDLICDLIEGEVLTNQKKSTTFVLCKYKDNFISYYGHQDSKNNFDK